MSRRRSLIKNSVFWEVFSLHDDLKQNMYIKLCLTATRNSDHSEILHDFTANGNTLDMKWLRSVINNL